MNVTGTLHTLLRRWYVTLPLLALSLGFAGVLFARPGPYQVESQVVLLPPQTITSQNGDNPFLGFDNSITLAADLLRRELVDPATAQALAAKGYTSSYQVSDDPDTSGPVLDVTVIGRDKTSVEQTLYGVTAEVATKLAQLQSGLPSADQLTSLVVYLDAKPVTETTKKARTPLIVFALGFVLTIAIPQMVDAAFTRRPAARHPLDEHDQVVRHATTTPVVAARTGIPVNRLDDPPRNRYADQTDSEATAQFARLTDPQQPNHP